MSDLEKRLRRLEDRGEIDDVVVRYFLAVDSDDFEGVGASFTEDATFASSGILNAQGREAIVAFIRSARDHMGLTVHTPHYGLYSFEGEDRARGIVGAHLELVLAGEPLFGAVRYQDVYVRTDKGWRIASRDMRTIHIAPWSQVGDAMLSDRPVCWPGAEPAATDYPRGTAIIR